MNTIITVDTDALQKIVDSLAIPTPTLLPLTLAIPTETGYELPKLEMPKILPPPPTYECPICYETDDSHLLCPNGHTALCLDCLAK